MFNIILMAIKTSLMDETVYYCRGKCSVVTRCRLRTGVLVLYIFNNTRLKQPDIFFLHFLSLNLSALDSFFIFFRLKVAHVY